MNGLPRAFTVDGFWLTRQHGPVALAVVGGNLEPGPLRPGLPHLEGVVLPGMVDAHVHLGLVDAAALAGGPVVEVHDLGWIPEIARGWRRHPPAGVRVRVAGAFLTAVGGYPAGRPWAPAGALRELPDRRAGLRAVAEAAGNGHDLVKLVLHTGGPLLDDDVLHTVVDAAHDRGLPVGVHAEGPDQARRAWQAGADLLVHAPWTERLPDPLLRAMARRMTWVSTLAVHPELARRRARDNLRRFLGHGGRVVYGTDLGNGPGPVGPRAEEIAELGRAGLSGDALLAVLTGPDRRALRAADALLGPGPVPRDADPAAAWFGTARRLSDAFGEAVA